MFYQQAQSPAADRGHQINKLHFFLSVCVRQPTLFQILHWTNMKHSLVLAALVVAASAVPFCPGEGKNGKNQRCVSNQ